MSDSLGGTDLVRRSEGDRARVSEEEVKGERRERRGKKEIKQELIKNEGTKGDVNGQREREREREWEWEWEWEWERMARHGRGRVESGKGEKGACG